MPTGGGAGRPLMIWLHGCGGPDPLGQGHGLVQVAEQTGFTVAFPVQPASANPAQCWNWFEAADIHRGQGEASIIAGITTTLQTELGADTTRTYVGGYSAGGAMTTVMGATYPDLYAAIAPSAGSLYDLTSGRPAAFTGEAAWTEMGARARPVPAFILQGTADEISAYPLGRLNLSQWLGTDDYADDGTADSSVGSVPAGVEPVVLATSPPLTETVEHYTAGGCAIADFVTTPGDHLANGALFYYAQGQALQQQMMTFLLGHRLGGPGVACG